MQGAQRYIIDIKKQNEPGYISNQRQGWAGKSNQLMGLMECELVKESQSLNVCSLHLKPLTFLNKTSALVQGLIQW